MSLLDKYKQKPTVVAEKGEYFKNPQGEVLKVSPRMPTHDDKYLVTEDTVEKVPSRKGGVVVDAETVVTASRENRPKSSKHYTDEDLALEITGKEAEDFAMNAWGLKVKAKGTISPSKMIDLAMESRDSLLKKYKGKEGIAGSSLSSTTNMANKAVLETLPDLEKIYDDVFELQESKRLPPEEQEIVQVGGRKNAIEKAEKKQKYFQKESNLGKYPRVREIHTAQEGKSKLKPYPYMKGSRPALETTSGKSIEVLDGRTISIDQIYDSDSVVVKGNEGKTFFKSKLKKYVK